MAQVPLPTTRVDCTEVLGKMRHNIAVDPGRLVLAMEDALTQNEVCVCPIVRSAVDLAGREPRLVSEILVAAIGLLPAASAQITECVLLEAPGAGPEIRATLARLLGDQAQKWLPAGNDPPVGKGAQPSEAEGKSPVGKEPLALAPMPSAIPAEAPEEDSSYPEVGVNGIYFTLRPMATRPENNPVRVVIRKRPAPKNAPGRMVSPVTGTEPE